MYGRNPKKWHQTPNGMKEKKVKSVLHSMISYLLTETSFFTWIYFEQYCIVCVICDVYSKMVTARRIFVVARAKKIVKGTSEDV